MSRNVKPGITFYRMDSGHIINKKVRLLFNEYGSDGYYIWSCLLDYAYGKWGYYFDMNDKDELELFATEYCRMKATLIESVITGCIRRGLFDKAVADEFGILTSAMMQEVFIIATSERRAKTSTFEMQEAWLLVKFDIVHRNLIIVPRKNIDSSPEESTNKTTQHNTETKQNTSAPAKPPRGVGKGKVAEEPEPYWQKLVDTWFEFGIEKFKVQPSFKGQDPKIFKRIIQLLKKRAESKNIAWTEVSAPQRLCFFLNAAFDDEWLCKHFLLTNLESKFDQVIQRQSQAAGKSKPGSASHIITKVYEVQLNNSQKEINYLYEQWREDHSKITIRSLETMQYDILQKAGRISFTDDRVSEIRQASIDYMEEKKLSLDEPAIGNYMKKFAILEFFKDQLNTDRETIFEIQTSIA